MPNIDTSPTVDRLIFTALDNQETIQKVVINRGNCTIAATWPKLPATLKYGETLSVSMAMGCITREAILQDGDHAYTFTWHN